MSEPIDPWVLGGDQSDFEELAALEREITESQEEDFVKLLKIAKLDPSLHLRFGNFAVMDFSGSDLSGCNFTGANLHGCRFDWALISRARFDRALVNREQLRHLPRVAPPRDPIHLQIKWQNRSLPLSRKLGDSLGRCMALGCGREPVTDGLPGKRRIHDLAARAGLSSAYLGAVHEGKDILGLEAFHILFDVFGGGRNTAEQYAAVAAFRQEYGRVSPMPESGSVDWDGHVRRWGKAERPGGDQHLRDLAVFSDAPFAPELVAMSAGVFMMGSPEDEKERFDDEGPQHKVTIRHRVAIGRFPVTFEEYDHYCRDTRRRKPSDEGWGRGRRPVVNVSWQDAQKYCEWLSIVTGMNGERRYRLPSEAEWEYATRAGTTTRFCLGDAITPKQANYVDSRLGRTSEVGSYPANPWGLYDVHGNVWEWVRDDWHSGYADLPTSYQPGSWEWETDDGKYGNAPEDGSAWIDRQATHQNEQVLRGGSWHRIARDCRSANRRRMASGGHDSIGLRVARTLTTA